MGGWGLLASLGLLGIGPGIGSATWEYTTALFPTSLNEYLIIITSFFLVEGRRKQDKSRDGM